jgi:hypothetical protein
MKRLLMIGMVLLCSCEGVPRDPGETSQRVMRDKAFRVGFVSPDISREIQTTRLIDQLEKTTGARSEVVAGSGEALLTRLQNGEVDILIGRFQAESPWASEVSMGPALSKSGTPGNPLELKAAMRNGENRWIMQIERASRMIRGEAR